MLSKEKVLWSFIPRKQGGDVLVIIGQKIALLHSEALQGERGNRIIISTLTQHLNGGRTDPALGHQTPHLNGG